MKYFDVLKPNTTVNLKHRFGKDYVPAVVEHVDKDDETYSFVWWDNGNRDVIHHTEIYVDHIIIDNSSGALKVTYKNAYMGVQTEYREDDERRKTFERYESALRKAFSPVEKGDSV